MLHFLIGTALCIWIAERVAHYWIGWRENRQLARALRTPSCQGAVRAIWLALSRLRLPRDGIANRLRRYRHNDALNPMAPVGSVATAG